MRLCVSGKRGLSIVYHTVPATFPSYLIMPLAPPSHSSPCESFAMAYITLPSSVPVRSAMLMILLLDFCDMLML